jgi:multidrug/hemolysin transport system ATP-binding protein
MGKVIEISGLEKSFRTVKAVNGLSFSVKEGELFAFLGVNGAGKSTTINIICGMLSADAGEVRVDGFDIKRDMASVRERLGVVFQGSVLDKSLTVRANLESRAALYGIHGEEFEKRLSYLSKLLDFSDILSRTVSKLSGGQRRRIDIARALIHSPRILILDEPTTGLDPQTRRLLWRVLHELRRERGMTVLLTTHYMEEAAEADYVIIIDGGKISAEGTPLELKNRYTGDYVSLYGVTEEQVMELGAEYIPIAGGFRLTVSNTAAATALITKNPELFLDYEVTKGKMDDVFLAVTGKKLDGGKEE